MWTNLKSESRSQERRKKNATKYQIAALAFVTNDLKPHLSSSCSSLGNINISCENLLFLKKEKKFLTFNLLLFDFYYIAAH